MRWTNEKCVYVRPIYRAQDKREEREGEREGKRERREKKKKTTSIQRALSFTPFKSLTPEQKTAKVISKVRHRPTLRERERERGKQRRETENRERRERGREGERTHAISFSLVAFLRSCTHPHACVLLRSEAGVVVGGVEAPPAGSQAAPKGSASPRSNDKKPLRPTLLGRSQR
jgi:hypothetical protein